MGTVNGQPVAESFFAIVARSLFVWTAPRSVTKLLQCDSPERECFQCPTRGQEHDVGFQQGSLFEPLFSLFPDFGSRQTLGAIGFVVTISPAGDR